MATQRVTRWVVLLVLKEIVTFVSIKPTKTAKNRLFCY